MPIKLVDALTGLDIAGGAASVTLYTSVIYTGYAYANLSAPITWQANESYYLVSQQSDGAEEPSRILPANPMRP